MKMQSAFCKKKTPGALEVAFGGGATFHLRHWLSGEPKRPSHSRGKHVGLVLALDEGKARTEGTYRSMWVHYLTFCWHGKVGKCHSITI